METTTSIESLMAQHGISSHSAYFNFTAQLVNQHPDTPILDIITQSVTQWVNMSEAEQDTYNEDSFSHFMKLHRKHLKSRYPYFDNHQIDEIGKNIWSSFRRSEWSSFRRPEWSSFRRPEGSKTLPEGEPYLNLAY
jgi:hypothetical protein